MTKTQTSRVRVAALATLGAVLLAACGTSDSEDSPDVSGDGESLTSVTVADVPSTNSTPLHYAIEAGIFEKNGLDVTIQESPDVPAAINAVASDNAQFTFPSMVGAVTAVSQGVPLVAIGPYNTSSTEPNTPELVGIIAVKGGGVEDAKDLEGKTVAVNSLNSIGVLHVSGAMESVGADWSTVNFVAVPFQQMPTALLKGEVQAAWTFDPFLTLGLEENDKLFKVVHNPGYLTEPGAPMGGWFTSKKMLEQHEATVKAFQVSMREAHAEMESNPVENRRIASKITKMDLALLERIALSHFPAETSEETIQKTVDLIEKYGLAKDVPPLEEWHVPNPMS